MKFQLATVLTLLPLALAIPAPASEAEPEKPIPIPELTDSKNEAQDIRPAALGLEKRATVSCKIVNTDSASVNCRYKPSLTSSVIARLPKGSTHSFYCYKKGDCYNGNWLVLSSPFHSVAGVVLFHPAAGGIFGCLVGLLVNCAAVPGIRCFTKSKSAMSMVITLIANALLVSMLFPILG